MRLLTPVGYRTRLLWNGAFVVRIASDGYIGGGGGGRGGGIGTGGGSGGNWGLLLIVGAGAFWDVRARATEIGVMTWRPVGV